MKSRATLADNGLQRRTKAFALQIIRLFSVLPKSPEAQVLGKQILRSGTSVGAYYREAMRARSRLEFISKIQGGLQELEETMYWLELLAEAAPCSAPHLPALQQEADQLMAMLVASAKTAKQH
ncbi:four helix bundle protein [Candidatus Nitrospira bockiana]